MGLFVKQHRPLETDVAELEEELTQARNRNDLFLITIRALLNFVKEFSLDLTEIGAEKFKQSIDTLSKRFTSEETIRKLQHAFEESKHLIISYIKDEKNYLQEREGEFKNIIELLSNGIHTINEENEKFNIEIYNSSSKLEKITYLNDIRQTKEELKQEIDKIRQSIKEKQRQDAQRLESLTRELEGLKVDFQKAKQASMMDGLCGVYNRVAFDAQLAKLIDRNMLSPVPFSLLILDIDDFKQINDTHGHPVGDRVILAVAQQCQELIRKDDFLARYGGEEFAIILPATSLRHGLKKARAICKTIAGSRYAVESQQTRTTLSFTVSIGVSTCQPGDTADSIVERADKALYEAKRLGKNRAVSEKQVG